MTKCPKALLRSETKPENAGDTQQVSQHLWKEAYYDFT